MLQDKYLPQYHFDEKHDILIKATPEKVYSVLEKLDMSGSLLIRLLFKLRGLPSAMLTTENLERHRFYTLEHIDNKEVIIGLIGQFWKPSGHLQEFKPHEFIPFSKPAFAKATWSFSIFITDDNSCQLETITRIQCTDESSRKKFSRYWFLIKPFSGLIRMEMLKMLKRNAELGETRPIPEVTINPI